MTYRLAMLCGCAPLLCTIFIGLRWISTGWHQPPLAEEMIIKGGLAVFIVGLALLAAHFISSCQKGSLTLRQAKRQGLVSGGILLLNLLIASGVFFLAVRIVAQYSLTIENACSERLESFVLIGPDIRHEYGPIAPGKEKQIYLKIQRNGQLAFRAGQGGKTFQGVIESHARSNMGVARRLVIKPAGTFILSNESEASGVN